MPELSQSSRNILSGTKKLLILIEKILKLFHNFFYKKCPQYLQNIATAILTLKDLVTCYVPAQIFKALFYIALFSIAYRKFKKMTNNHSVKKPAENHIQPLNPQHFSDLDPEFEVKQNHGPSIGGNVKAQIDSCCLDFADHIQQKPKDFRDIVFFELMKSYNSCESKQNQQSE